MTLKIISAEQIEFEGTVEQVTLPGVMGQFQVLTFHLLMVVSSTVSLSSHERLVSLVKMSRP